MHLSCHTQKKDTTIFMARINVESDLFQDHRFQQLTIKLGNSDQALGALVRAWALAQKWYLTPDRMIPVSEWIKQSINMEILTVGLAVQHDKKIKVCGADKQFAWLLQRHEAGKNSGISRRNQTNIKNTSSDQLETQGVMEIIDNLGQRTPTVEERLGTSLLFTTKYKEEYKEEDNTRQQTNFLSPDKPTTLACNKNELVRLWNERAHSSLPRVRSLTGKRARAVGARLREVPDLKTWVEAIEKINHSPFCLGIGGNGWVANFDFLTRPDSLTKILEGNYDGKPKLVSVKAQQQQEFYSAQEARLQAEENRAVALLGVDHE